MLDEAGESLLVIGSKENKKQLPAAGEAARTLVETASIVTDVGWNV